MSDEGTERDEPACTMHRRAAQSSGLMNRRADVDPKVVSALKDSSARLAGQVLRASVLAQPLLGGKVFLTFVADVVSARVCQVLRQSADAREGAITTLAVRRHVE